jgi:two-component system response regulator (stage 0 sporulation protein F)
MIKLLIVDDEKGIIGALKEFFEYRGFSVKAVGSGEEALAAIKEDKPGIIFLDIRMKGMSGIETLKHIKDIDKNIKVIMLTVHNEKEIIGRAGEIGADGYITKPFRIDYLEEVVINKVQELLKG